MHVYLYSGAFRDFLTVELQWSDNQTTGYSAWEIQETAAPANDQA